jgi:PBP1b-binding outer membrane lipoprotein LpoB
MKSLLRYAAVATVSFAGVAMVSGCATQTRRYADGEVRQTVTGFSEEDINDTVSRAVQSVYSQDRIKLRPGANRAILIVEDVVNDTTSRGRDAGALAESLGQSLREELTNGGKVVVYNRSVAQYATVKVDPQYILRGRLVQRNLRQDDGDIQIEYNLNLTLIDIQTGLEFWQKRVHVGKLADKKNIM